MTGERNFREEAQTARRAARETLLAYREARLRSRRSMSGNTGRTVTTDEAGADDDGALIRPESFFSMPEHRPAPDAAQADGPEEPGDQADDAPDISANEGSADPSITDFEPVSEVEEHTGDGADAATTDATAMTLPRGETEDGLRDDAALPTSDETDDVAPGVATVDPDSDLFQLPAAGAGMIWMFHQCGIRSLEDLAAADPHDLSLRLGVVGHILNIEPWILFARERRQA